MAVNKMGLFSDVSLGNNDWRDHHGNVFFLSLASCAHLQPRVCGLLGLHHR